MKEEMSTLSIRFRGETFREINGIIDDEEERLRTTLILYSKMADVYEDVFKSNPNIVFVSREVFGDIIIDDNHVVVCWNVFGRKIEFYFEEYWGVIALSIETAGSEITIQEIVKAFENHYSKKLTYEMAVEGDSKGFRLSLCDELPSVNREAQV